MNDLRNKLFFQLSAIVLVVIIIFEGTLIFILDISFKNQIKEKMLLVANSINREQITPTYIIALEKKYNIYPLFIKISNEKETKLKFTINSKNKILTLVYPLKGKTLYLSTFYTTTEEKMNIIKSISLTISLFIYLIILMIGYKFIDNIANELESAFEKLKVFNSNLSHELKTPLTIIKTKIELALKENKCDKESLKETLDEINYINEITEKLLFLTKNDNFNIKLKNIDLEEIVIEIFEKYSNKININLDIDEDDFIIKGDNTLINIVLSNLLDNAIKYGATEITISLKKLQNIIYLEIKDNGIGIQKDKLSFIFDEFYRVDSSHNRKIKGFGLGLSIVKSIIKSHNADIKVESQEGKGTKFIIKFKGV